MLRDALGALADVLRDSIGDTLADDDIDAEIEPRLVASPSAPVCIDMYPGPTARESTWAAFGDISGYDVVIVRVRTPAATDTDETQDILVDMLDDSHDLSVSAAIESDETLKGYATDVIVDPDGISGMLMFGEGSSQPMVGCTWRVLLQVAVS